MHFQRGSGELGWQDCSSRTARHCFRPHPTQLRMQDDQRSPACQGHPQLQNSRSHLLGSPSVPGKRKRSVTLVPQLSRRGDLPPVSHRNPRNHVPSSPLPSPPPLLFTDRVETIRLKIEGKSWDTGHNHPGLGSPCYSHGLQDSPRRPRRQPSSPEGRGRWLQE